MRLSPLTVAFLYPATSLASGGEILVTLWLEAILFVAVLVSVTRSGLTWVARLSVFGAYLIAVTLSWVATSDMPYEANHLLINAVCVGLPAIVWAGGFFLAARFGKNITSRSTRSRAKTRAPG
jgi:hypothetical protein